MANFVSASDGDVYSASSVGVVNPTSIYITEAEMIDQYVGCQILGWGRNSSGQLGDNTNGSNLSNPVANITGATNWKQLSCGADFTAGVKTDGTLWTWGANITGQLGDNTSTPKSSPVQTVATNIYWRQVTTTSFTGGGATLAIDTTGQLWAWGGCSNGELGDNTTVNKSSPVQTITSGTNWKQVSGGQTFVGAVKTDGTLWTWGANSNGQLGNNNAAVTMVSSPIQVVGNATTWSSVACGTSHTAAIKTDGTLWVWGRNSSGQLGDNSTVDKSSPVQTVAAGSNWKQAVCAQSSQGLNMAAIKTDGSLWTWGDNTYGQLGNNSAAVTMVSSPIQVVGNSTTWKTAFYGCYTMGAIKTDGTLWIWGRNLTNILGLADTVSAAVSSPLQMIAGGSSWKQAALCSYFIGNAFQGLTIN